jgi:hypothetical protein
MMEQTCGGHKSSLDLGQLPFARIRFEGTTCNVGDGIDALREFCELGTMESNAHPSHTG